MNAFDPAALECLAALADSGSFERAAQQRASRNRRCRSACGRWKAAWLIVANHGNLPRRAGALDSIGQALAEGARLVLRAPG